MVATDEQGETLPEIAARHHRAFNTVRNQWSRHPEWPPSIGKSGRRKTYDPSAVDDFVRDHVARETVKLEAARLYTAQQLEEAGIGITAGTIRADLTRHRWPEPDSTEDGVNRWRGSTATAALEKRRGYRRS
ncbi:hypothetical protein QFW82_23580 [Streptomyces malaysiensis subsp. malaysiensis]|uniref:hypothetical protein n=1 Tax=Streptomyces malaysiensis TaxID=92644 RepID=UPI0024C04B75|nr:hypothetical protein [Streptomyces sp. NA07423]WHX19813.1 hypothetical protein QFW82_23580 [Streptomyces sp. NA07423]